MLGGEGPVEELLAVVGVRPALDERDGTDLVSGALTGEGGLEHVEALLLVLHAVVAEDHAHRDLTTAGHLARGRSALGVLQDVVVQLGEVVEGLLLVHPVEHHLRPHRGVGRSRRGRVGDGDVLLQLRVEQVRPGGGRLHAELLEDVLVGAEAERPDVGPGPGAVGSLVLLGDLRGVGRDVLLGEPGLRRGDVAVGGTAVEDVELGLALGGVEAGHTLARAHPHVGRLDPGALGERGGHGLALLLLRRAGDHDVAAGLGLGGAPAGVSLLDGAAGEQRPQTEGQREQRRRRAETGHGATPLS